MRAYECVYILDPTLEELAIKEKADRISEIVTSRKGEVHKVNHWGKRRLAYEIGDFQEGIYTAMNFSGDNDILRELNRVFRFDDAVLRYIIVVDENPPAKKVEEAARETEG